MQAASLAAADSRALAWGAGGGSCAAPGLESAGSTMVHKGSGLISKFLRLPLPAPAAHLSFRRCRFSQQVVRFPSSPAPRWPQFCEHDANQANIQDGAKSGSKAQCRTALPWHRPTRRCHTMHSCPARMERDAGLAIERRNLRTAGVGRSGPRSAGEPLSPFRADGRHPFGGRQNLFGPQALP